MLDIFNKFGKNGQPVTSKYLNSDGFFIVKTLSTDESALVDAAFNSGGILFDEMGNVWDATKQSVIVYNFNSSPETNQLSWQKTFENSILTVSGVNPDLALISEANYFVSQPSSTYGNLGGWLLFKEPNGDSNSYYILYNPLNRHEMLNTQSANTPADLYQTYCNTISLQDPMCYCLTGEKLGQLTPNTAISPTGGTNNYCYFSSIDSKNGRKLGLEMEELGSTNPQFGSQISKLQEACNCMGTCGNVNSNNANNPLWPSFKNIFQVGTSCAQLQDINLTACLQKFNVGGSDEDTGNNILNCSSEGPSPSPGPSPPGPAKSNTTLYIIIGVIVLIVIGIILYFFMGKNNSKLSNTKKST
jgi:hypothetical protein